jgi:hypothetical protein
LQPAGVAVEVETEALSSSTEAYSEAA